MNANLVTAMKNAHYNATIWETYEKNPSGNSLPITENLINLLNSNGIDSYLVDYNSEYNGTDLTSAGATTLSTGNQWKFEAEYQSEVDVNNLDRNNSRFWHKFDTLNNTRVGQKAGDIYASNGNVWLCNPALGHQAGVAVDKLQWRWSKYSREGGLQGHSYNNYQDVGSEFRFTLYDGNAVNGNSYLTYNKLYYTVSYKLDPNAPDAAEALTFGIKFKKSDDTYDFVIIHNVISGGDVPGDPTIPYALTYTYGQLRSSTYSSEIVDGNGYRTITFVIDMMDLKNNDMINTRGYWFSSLWGMSPYVEWHGGHIVSIDYIEIQDKMYRNLVDNTADAWLTSRLNKYSAASKSAIKRFYSLDEPSQPQFAAFSILSNKLNSSNMKHVATLNWNAGDIIKGTASPSGTASGDGDPYSYPELYLDYNNPSELMVDYYPLEGNHNWNIDPETSVPWDRVKSVQWNIDWRALKHYRSLKAKSETNNTPFYVAPVSAGYFGNNPNNPDGFGQWGYYLLPTPQMQKCLQLLPLCYGVDGIMNYKLYAFEPVNTQTDHPHEPWDPEIISTNDRNDHDWYALVDVNGSTQEVTTTPAYDAIVEANDKILTYGPILKGLNWKDSGYLNPDGIHLQSDIYGAVVDINLGTNYATLTASQPNFNPATDKYQGYVQAGIFEDNFLNPSYMFVNRRTNFVNSPGVVMQYLTPDQIRYNENNNYSIAPDQIVRIELNTNVRNVNSKALYDPYSDKIIKKAGDSQQTPIYPYFEIPLAAGDGILVQMVEMLPDLIISHIEFADSVYASDIINVSAGGSLDLTGKTRFVKDCQININNGGLVNIRGIALAGNNVKIVVNAGGILNIDAATCTFSGDASIEVNRGILNITDATLNKSTKVENWTGIINRINGTINIKNSKITDALVGIDNFGTVTVNNTVNHISSIENCQKGIALYSTSTFNTQNFQGFKIKVPSYGYGITVDRSILATNALTIGNSQYKTIEISAIDGASPTLGIFESGTGYNPNGMPSLSIKNILFKNLTSAMDYYAFNKTGNIITGCTFLDCIHGINVHGNGFVSEISLCEFVNEANTDFTSIGLNWNTSGGSIWNCSFTMATNRQIGMVVNNSCALGSSRNALKIDACNFTGGRGIISVASSPRITNCVFNCNVGIVCSQKSYIDCAEKANNILSNNYYNVSFDRYLSNASSFNSSMYLINGHNDFYKQNTDTKDLFFLSPFEAGDNEVLNISGNYWGNPNQPVIGAYGCTIPTIVNYAIDPGPNVEITEHIRNRFEMALSLEADSVYSEALSTYKSILEEKNPGEKYFWFTSIDKIYNLSFQSDFSIENALFYFNDAVLAIPDTMNIIDQQLLRDIISDYIMKCNIVLHDYPSALAIASGKLQNATSQQDSLLYVLCVETIYQLMNIEGSKAASDTYTAKLRPKDTYEFRSRYQDHLQQLLNSTLGNLPGENDASISPKVVLNQNYPNPFNPTTTIVFSIPEHGQVDLSVYNIKGQKVKTLLNEPMLKGKHSIVWDGKNSNRKPVSSGIYFYKITAGKKTIVKKMIMMK